jgi:hypothetical protein
MILGGGLSRWLVAAEGRRCGGRWCLQHYASSVWEGEKQRGHGSGAGRPGWRSNNGKGEVGWMWPLQGKGDGVGPSRLGRPEW